MAKSRRRRDKRARRKALKGGNSAASGSNTPHEDSEAAKPQDASLLLRRRPKPADQYTGPISFLRVYAKHLRRYLMTGMLVWVPLIVTIWVSWWLIKTVGLNLEAFIERLVLRVNAVGFRVPSLHFLTWIHYMPGLGFLSAILLFLTTGFLARYLVTRRIIAFGEAVLGKIPLVNRVYVASQQIRDVFVNREGAVFQQVVLVEYPRRGLSAVGFVTSSERGIVQEASGKNLTAVFVPTTPNPTSGFLLYFPPEELAPLDISVEDAMKMIISGGAFIPGQQVEAESPPKAD